jgi:UDP-GlcNAc:undecaprenyl-phosphate GlcNAc-1-phosphate transferase
MIKNIEVQLIVIFLSSLVLSLLFIKFFRKNSVAFGLIDKPNHRKVHLVPTPVIGGISIFCAVMVSAFLSKRFLELIYDYPQVFGASIVIVIIAIWDDRKNLPAVYRLLVQLLTAFAIAASGIRITSFNGIFGIYELSDFWQYFTTIVFLAFATNAFNLMDGVDGLMGSIAFINFGILSLLFYALGMHVWIFPMVGFMGALLQFLRSNFSKEKIFMGDAGSMGLGFFINVMAVMALQKSISVNTGLPVYSIVASLLFIPFIDAVRVFITRMKKGNSPFTPDRNHLHHLWMMAGMKHIHITFFIVLSHVLFIALCYILANHISILFSIVGLSILFFSIVKFLYFNRHMEEWMGNIKEMETSSSSQPN